MNKSHMPPHTNRHNLEDKMQFYDQLHKTMDNVPREAQYLYLQINPFNHTTTKEMLLKLSILNVIIYLDWP